MDTALHVRALLDEKDLAQELKVTTRTIRNYRQEGLIPYIRMGKRAVRFDLTDVIAFLKKRGGNR
jgi:excisionase family DNA binding protein